MVYLLHVNVEHIKRIQFTNIVYGALTCIDTDVINARYKYKMRTLYLLFTTDRNINKNSAPRPTKYATMFLAIYVSISGFRQRKIEYLVDGFF